MKVSDFMCESVDEFCNAWVQDSQETEGFLSCFLPTYKIHRVLIKSYSLGSHCSSGQLLNQGFGAVDG